MCAWRCDVRDLFLLPAGIVARVSHMHSVGWSSGKVAEGRSDRELAQRTRCWWRP